MPKVKDVYDFLDFSAPYNTAAEWDNTGLSVGSFYSDVTKILVALDVTNDVIEKAKSIGADLVITHHPLIFNPLKSVEKGSVVYNAVSSGINFISSHTCLDKAFAGVNDCLARKLGIKNTYTSQYDEFLKIGTVEKTTPENFAEKIKSALGGTVRYTNENKPIEKVGFCSGSGGDCIFGAKLENVDAFVTGDASHHDFLNAHENGISFFAAGHFETENPVTDYLYRCLKEQYSGEAEIELYSERNIIKTV